MFAWQSLTTEEKIPYTFQRPLEGGGLAFATDNDDWSDFDITYEANWGLDGNVSRAFEDTGYRVSDFIWLDEPSVFREEIVDGESQLTFDHFDAEANDDIKRMLIETGAVEVGIAAEQSLPDDAGTGEFTNYNEWCQYNSTDPYQANHVVTIVGWDDDYPASNFSGQAGAPDGNGAWLVKNSWGSAQMYAADRGYHSYWASSWRMPLSDGDIDPDKNGSGFFGCPITTDPLAISPHGTSRPSRRATTSITSTTYLGWAEAGLIPNSNEPAAAANVFTAKGPELLRATTLFTMYAPVVATVRVYLLDDGDEVPADGKLAAEESFALEQPGCRTLELKDPVKLPADQRYAAVEEIVRESEEGSQWDISLRVRRNPGARRTAKPRARRPARAHTAWQRPAIEPSGRRCSSPRWPSPSESALARGAANFAIDHGPGKFFTRLSPNNFSPVRGRYFRVVRVCCRNPVGSIRLEKRISFIIKMITFI